MQDVNYFYSRLRQPTYRRPLSQRITVKELMAPYSGLGDLEMIAARQALGTRRRDAVTQTDEAVIEPQTLKRKLQEADQMVQTSAQATQQIIQQTAVQQSSSIFPEIEVISGPSVLFSQQALREEAAREKPYAKQKQSSLLSSPLRNQRPPFSVLEASPLLSYAPVQSQAVSQPILDRDRTQVIDISSSMHVQESQTQITFNQPIGAFFRVQLIHSIPQVFSQVSRPDVKRIRFYKALDAVGIVQHLPTSVIGKQFILQYQTLENRFDDEAMDFAGRLFAVAWNALSPEKQVKIFLSPRLFDSPAVLRREIEECVQVVEQIRADRGADVLYEFQTVQHISGHWFAFKLKGNKFEVADSIGLGQHPIGSQFLGACRQVLNRCGIAQIPETLIAPQRTPIPRQENSVDCGPYCILWLQGNEQWTPAAAGHLRQFLKCFLT